MQNKYIDSDQALNEIVHLILEGLYPIIEIADEKVREILKRKYES